MAFEPGRSDSPGSDGPLARDEGVDKRQVSRLAVAGIALLVAATFVVQNNDEVKTTFLVFSVETSLWVGLVVSLLLGAVLGQAFTAVWHRRRRRDDD